MRTELHSPSTMLQAMVSVASPVAASTTSERTTPWPMAYQQDVAARW